MGATVSQCSTVKATQTGAIRNTAVRIAPWDRCNVAYKPGWGYTVPITEYQHNQKGREKYRGKKKQQAPITVPSIANL